MTNTGNPRTKKRATKRRISASEPIQVHPLVVDGLLVPVIGIASYRLEVIVAPLRCARRRRSWLARAVARYARSCWQRRATNNPPRLRSTRQFVADKSCGFAAIRDR